MLDVVALAAVFVFWVLGMTSGFLLQLLRLIVAVLGVLAASRLTEPAMMHWPDLLADQPAIRELLFPIALFLFVYVVGAVLSKGLVRVLHGSSSALTTMDRVLGGILGVAKGMLLVYFMVSLLIASETLGYVPPMYLETDDSLVADVVRNTPLELPKEFLLDFPVGIDRLNEGLDGHTTP